MRTLATGFGNNSVCRRNAGFSLVELLVVVVILAVVMTAGMAWLRYGVNERRVEQAAQRIMATIDFLCQQAVLQNRSLGLAFFQSGYVAVQAPSQAAAVLDASGMTAARHENTPWPAVPDSVLPRGRWEIPDGMRWSLFQRQRRQKLQDEAPPVPQVICDSAGVATPFLLRLQEPATDAWYQLEYRRQTPRLLYPGSDDESVTAQDSRWQARWIKEDAL